MSEARDPTNEEMARAMQEKQQAAFRFAAIRDSLSPTDAERAELAEIAGLRLSCFSDGHQYYSKDTVLVCLPRDLHPESNWGHLGMVIEGMVARGLLLHIEWANREGYCRVWFEPARHILRYFQYCEQPISQLRLAICRAVLAAAKEEEMNGRRRKHG